MKPIFSVENSEETDQKQTDELPAPELPAEDQNQVQVLFF